MPLDMDIGTKLSCEVKKKKWEEHWFTEYSSPFHTKEYYKLSSFVTYKFYSQRLGTSKRKKREVVSNIHCSFF